MSKDAKKEDLVRKEIRTEQRNINDEIFINLVRFMGAFIILMGLGVLISRELVFNILIIVLFVIGLAMIIGASFWESGDKKEIDDIKQEERKYDEKLDVQ